MYRYGWSFDSDYIQVLNEAVPLDVVPRGVVLMNHTIYCLCVTHSIRSMSTVLFRIVFRAKYLLVITFINKTVQGCYAFNNMPDRNKYKNIGKLL